MSSKRPKAPKCTKRNRARAKTEVLAHTFGRLLTVADVADELRVDRRKVMQLVNGGHLAWIDLGSGTGRKLVRVGRYQLDEYLAACVRPPVGCGSSP